MSALLFALLAVAIALTIRRSGARFTAIAGRVDAAAEGWSRTLDRHFIFIDPARLKAILRIVALVSLALAAFDGGRWIAAGLASVTALPLIILRRIETSRRRRFVRQFHPWIASFAAMVRSGLAVEKAMAATLPFQAAPLSQELSLVLKEMRVGVPVEDALGEWARRQPGRDMDLFVRSVTLSLRTGCALSTALETLAGVLARRKAIEDRLDALTLQGRLQGWIGAALPLGVFAAVQAFAPGYFEPILEHPSGNAMVLGAGFALAVGALWIHRLAQPEAL